MDSTMEVSQPVSDHEASKVHFSTDVGLNTEINVKPTSGDSIDVRLGFLAEGHTYEVQFDIPNLLGGDLEVPGLQNPEIQIVNVRPIDGYQSSRVTLEMNCRLEGKMKKELVLETGLGKQLKLTIYARVMGKRRGTPMLKNGIRCVHMETDAVSDASDWQGFD